MEHQCNKIIIVISQALLMDDISMKLINRAEEIRAIEMPNGFGSARIIPLIIEDCPVVGNSLISISPVNFRSHPEWAWTKLLRALQTE